jgi:dihydroorotase
MLKHRARGLHGTRLYPVGALTVGLEGETITEMAELAEAGCVGFSQALAPIVDTQVLMRAMQYACTYGYTVWLHPQDPHLARGGVAHAGACASRLGLPGIPTIAETVALNTIFDLVRVHQGAARRTDRRPLRDVRRMAFGSRREGVCRPLNRAR